MIFIIIPVHNRLHFTRKCMFSLRRQTVQFIKTIIVDDGSTDGTKEWVKNEYPDSILLKGTGSLWWAGAINLGVEYALSHAGNDDFILTMNNDTIVPSNYIQILFNSALKHHRSIIGSISLRYKDQSIIVDGGNRINWLTAKYSNLTNGRQYEDVLRELSYIQKVDVLSGRGTLIPVEVFKKIGLYDFQHLPHYGADYEFSRRANLNGYNLLINYKAVVVCNEKATGINNRISRLKFCSLVRSFFSIRSSNNLKFRLNFARLCRLGWKLPIFYICDTARLIMGSMLYQFGFKRFKYDD